MTTTPRRLAPPPSEAEARIAWGAAIFACFYFGWLYFVLSRHTSAVAGLLAGLGAELPASTAFVTRHHSWLYPLLFGGAALFVLLKERWIRDKRISTALTFSVALVAQAIADHCRETLLVPLIDLMGKLS